MATKTKKPVKTTKSKKPAVSRLQASRSFNLGYAIIIAGVLLLIGIVFVVLASATTIKTEVEDGTRSTSGVAVGTDIDASAGKYAQFTQATTTTTKTQRFPGDPNIRVTGKTYWGSSIGGNADPIRHEGPTGKSLALRRTFWGWNDSKMFTSVKADIAADRLPLISMKTPGWAEVASGRQDATLDSMLRQLDAAGGPVWLIVHHEPEGGCNTSCAANGMDDIGGAPAWRAMQVKIRERMNVVGTKNIAFFPAPMAWTWDPASGRNPEDWYVPGIWDGYFVDAYCDFNCSDKGKTTLTSTQWVNFSKWADAKGIPYGTAEWGMRGSDAAAGQAVQDFWENGFKNNKDIIGLAYFDSALNSPNGSWELVGSQLTTFQNILKSDTRVQRISTLPKSTTTTAGPGTITMNLTVPDTDTYRLWVRVKAESATNNAFQAQIGTASAVKMGDGGIELNTGAWTWVDYKDGNIASKVDVALTQGVQKLVLTGIESGVKLDRVLITNENCTPVGVGDNCTPVADTIPPVVTITKPIGGATLKGDVVVTADVTDNVGVNRVSFLIDNVRYETVTTAPYQWTWDTTNVADGEHVILVKGYDDANSKTEKTIKVKVANGTVATPAPTPSPTATPAPSPVATPTPTAKPTPTPTPKPVADTTAPTAPVVVKPGLILDWTRVGYYANLTWKPSTDNVGVKDYLITRNSVTLGASGVANYKDYAIGSDQQYIYQVTARDAAGNTAVSNQVTMTARCALIFCWVE